MAANPALWADIARDLDAAAENAAAAVRRDRSLADPEAVTDVEARRDREVAIGVMLHNCYGALESALERLIQAMDGSLPVAPAYHSELVRRAAAPVPGLRPPMISPETASRLDRLRAFRHAFRHAYGGYDYSRAAENVQLAAGAVALFRRDIEVFAKAHGILSALDQRRTNDKDA
jgi:hypothetical protein